MDHETQATVNPGLAITVLIPSHTLLVILPLTIPSSATTRGPPPRPLRPPTPPLPVSPFPLSLISPLTLTPHSHISSPRHLVRHLLHPPTPYNNPSLLNLHQFLGLPLRHQTLQVPVTARDPVQAAADLLLASVDLISTVTLHSLMSPLRLTPNS
jgi:hypothetical protein